MTKDKLTKQDRAIAYKMLQLGFGAPYICEKYGLSEAQLLVELERSVKKDE